MPVGAEDELLSQRMNQRPDETALVAQSFGLGEVIEIDVAAGINAANAILEDCPQQRLARAKMVVDRRGVGASGGLGDIAARTWEISIPLERLASAWETPF